MEARKIRKPPLEVLDEEEAREEAYTESKGEARNLSYLNKQTPHKRTYSSSSGSSSGALSIVIPVVISLGLSLLLIPRMVPSSSDLSALENRVASRVSSVTQEAILPLSTGLAETKIRLDNLITTVATLPQPEALDSFKADTEASIDSKFGEVDLTLAGFEERVQALEADPASPGPSSLTYSLSYVKSNRYKLIIWSPISADYIARVTLTYPDLPNIGDPDISYPEALEVFYSIVDVDEREYIPTLVKSGTRWRLVAVSFLTSSFSVDKDEETSRTVTIEGLEDFEDYEDVFVELFPGSLSGDESEDGGI